MRGKKKKRSNHLHESVALYEESYKYATGTINDLNICLPANRGSEPQITCNSQVVSVFDYENLTKDRP